jgi:hypothetical protein
MNLKNKILLPVFLIFSQHAFALKIENAVSPSKKFELYEASLNEKSNYKSFYVGQRKEKIATVVYEEGEVGSPLVTRAIAKWSANEKFLVVKLEFLKTCKVIVFGRNLDNKFKKLRCDIPETTMLQDVDENKFGLNFNNGFRIDSTSCELESWVDDAEIKIRQEVIMTNGKGESKIYAVKFRLISDKSNMKLADFKSLGQVK